ncbi:5812_t:CDS:2, partial [Racocetra fulgida]
REFQKPSIILSDVLFEIDDCFIFQKLLQQANDEYKSDEVVKVEICCIGSKQYNTVASEVKRTLQYSKLELLIEAIEKCISQPWARSKSWNEFVEEVFKLVSCVQKYIKYLESVNENDSNIEIQAECFSQNVKECYNLLAAKMSKANNYEIILLDEYLPEKNM